MEEENKNPDETKAPAEWRPAPRRSSLFGQTFVKQPESSNDEEQYKQQMIKEILDWDTLHFAKSEDIEQLKKRQLIVDESSLDPAAKNYIDTGLNLIREYLDGLETTKKAVNYYMEERMVLLEAKNALNHVLMQIADEESFNLIEATHETH